MKKLMLALTLALGAVGFAPAATDYTSKVEDLGNEMLAAAYKPTWTNDDGVVKTLKGAYYARNVWTMATFNDKIFFGGGNSSNGGPGQVSSGVKVYVYNPSTGVFTTNTTIKSTQLDRFRIFNNRLYIPGHDPTTGSSEPGNYYYLESGGTKWTAVLDQIPAYYGIHTYDISGFNDKLNVCGYGTSWSSTLDGTGSWSSNPSSWMTVIANMYRFYTFLEFPTAIYAVGGEGGPLSTASSDYAFYRTRNYLAKRRASGASSFSDVSGVTFAQLFPDTTAPADGENDMKISRAVTFGSRVIYIGGYIHLDHQVRPVGAYTATDGSSMFTSAKIDLGNSSAQPWYVMTVNDKVYILWTTKSGNVWTNHVSSSTDGVNFTEEFYFTFGTKEKVFARSMTYHNGYFYFGMGTEIDADGTAVKDGTTNIKINVTYDVSELSEYAGTILRIKPSSDPEPTTTYTVSFNADGGSPVPSSQNITTGGKVTEPTAPTKADNNFECWYNGSTQWNFATDTVSSNITLKAKWTAVTPGTSVTVTFDTDGGAPVPESQILEAGDTITQPADPSRNGSTFIGWYKRSSAAVKNLHTARQDEFLSLSDDNRRTNFFNQTYRNKMVQSSTSVYAWSPEPVTISWTGDASATYTVVVRDAVSGKVVVNTTVTGATSCQTYNYELDRAYAWTVTATDFEESGSFRTSSTAPRFLYMPHMSNTRDFGGWVTTDGRRVRQGKMIRTAQLMDKNRATDLTAEDIAYINSRFGIKTEIDLRKTYEIGKTNYFSALGEGVTYTNILGHSYSDLDDIATTSKQWQEIFKIITDESKYPVIYHCVAGQDRTGIVSYLLNGALGVSESDLLRDWETSGFYNKKIAEFNHTNCIDKLIVDLSKRYPSATSARERCESYLKDCGITDAQLNTFRSLMLEPAETAWDFANDTVSSDMTLLARWTSGPYVPVATYSVTFDADGGTPTPAAQQVSAGGFVTEPTAPTKTDNTFEGWYNGSTQWNFATDTVSSNITLKAKWTAVGPGPEPTGSEANLLAWYLGKSPLDTDALAIQVTNQNCDLVMLWGSTSASKYPSYAEFTRLDGYVNSDKIGYTHSIYFRNSGYALVHDYGLVTSGNIGMQRVVVKDGNGQLYALVNYAGNVNVSTDATARDWFDGCISEIKTDYPGAIVLMDVCRIKVATPTLESAVSNRLATQGFTLANKTGKNSLFTLGVAGTVSGTEVVDTTVCLTNGTKFTFRKTTEDPEPMAVTFDADGGTPVPAAQSIVNGGKVVEPPAPTKTDFTFDGWYNGSTLWNFATDTVTADLTLKAKWTAVPPPTTTYTVTFDADGGTPTPAAQQVSAGGFVTEPTAPTKADNNFEGWYNGSAQWNFATDTVSADLTLKAKWTAAPPPAGQTGMKVLGWTIRNAGLATLTESQKAELPAEFAANRPAIAYLTGFSNGAEFSIPGYAISAAKKEGATIQELTSNAGYGEVYAWNTAVFDLEHEFDAIISFEDRVAVRTVVLTVKGSDPVRRFVFTTYQCNVGKNLSAYTDPITNDIAQVEAYLGEKSVEGWFVGYSTRVMNDSTKEPGIVTFYGKKGFSVVSAANEFKLFLRSGSSITKSDEHMVSNTVVSTDAESKAIVGSVVTLSANVPDGLFTVSFDADGGTPVPTNVTAFIGTKIEAPTAPTKADFNFDGWYNGDAAWNFSTDYVLSNITLKAKWNSVTPSWDVPGSKGGGIKGFEDPVSGDKYVTFGEIHPSATGLTLALSAEQIQADDEDYLLICKTELLAAETFNISAKLTGSGTEGLFTVLMDMTGYPKLFILGIAPATK